MKPGKSPGPDNIPLELLTHGGPELKQHLLDLILRIWDTKTAPDDFRNANIVTNFKKSDRENCGNYRGISLLSIASKIFARILLNRLLIVADEVLPESQCGFRPSRETTEMIFCARQIQEKCQEQQQPVMFIVWDFKKAFDKVPRPAMWAVLARYGYPEYFISLIRILHDRHGGQSLERFQQAKLRQILNIRWEDRVSNTEVLKRAAIPNTEAIIHRHRLRWPGHVLRMAPNRLPKIFLYGELAEGSLLRVKVPFKRHIKKAV
ncbi:uncharacterized protein LOC125037644 [Penaeus chinensis]|uniref:uncharacterized protein LOC125037644 n=1 Tax=Penaeus chinensis TaxID=139456 RepID=UPI001FB5CDCF|nr:uncharacterized protein LOC125037644 [Penaeus chinensis]